MPHNQTAPRGVRCFFCSSLLLTGAVRAVAGRTTTTTTAVVGFLLVAGGEGVVAALRSNIHCLGGSRRCRVFNLLFLTSHDDSPESGVETHFGTLHPLSSGPL